MDDVIKAILWTRLALLKCGSEEGSSDHSGKDVVNFPDHLLCKSKPLRPSENDCKAKDFRESCGGQGVALSRLAYKYPFYFKASCFLGQPQGFFSAQTTPAAAVPQSPRRSPWVREAKEKLPLLVSAITGSAREVGGCRRPQGASLNRLGRLRRVFPDSRQDRRGGSGAGPSLQGRALSSISPGRAQRRNREAGGSCLPLPFPPGPPTGPPAPPRH